MDDRLDVDWLALEEVVKALSKARAEMTNPAFDGQNPHFKSRYVSLDGVRKAVMPVFRKHGLDVIQQLYSGDSGPVIRTVVVHHASGESLILSDLEIPSAKKDPQGWGSAITYGLRYTLQAVAGVVGEEDDDGERAVIHPAVKGAQPRR